MRDKRRIVDPLEELKKIKPLGVMDSKDVEDIAFCAKKEKRQTRFRHAHLKSLHEKGVV